MNHAQLDLVRNAATAVLWKIEHLVEAGETFASAKDKAIKHASQSWKGFTPEIREAIWTVAKAISPDDVAKDLKRRQKDRHMEAIETHRGRNAGRVERLLYRFTGLTF